MSLDSMDQLASIFDKHIFAAEEAYEVDPESRQDAREFMNRQFRRAAGKIQKTGRLLIDTPAQAQ